MCSNTHTYCIHHTKVYLHKARQNIFIDFKCWGVQYSTSTSRSITSKKRNPLEFLFISMTVAWLVYTARFKFLTLILKVFPRSCMTSLQIFRTTALLCHTCTRTPADYNPVTCNSRKLPYFLFMCLMTLCAQFFLPSLSLSLLPCGVQRLLSTIGPVTASTHQNASASPYRSNPS